MSVMKKSTSMVAVLVVLCIILAGCGGAGAPSATPAGSEPDSTAAQGNGSTAQEPLKIALMLNGNLGDFAFFDSAANGIQMAIDDYGIEGKVFEAGFDRTTWKPTLYDIASEDWDLIITGTYDIQEILEEVALEFPDQLFVHYDSALDFSDGAFPNVYSMEYIYNQGTFLGGYVSAAITETDNIGVIGAMSVPAVNDFMIGYIAGAQYRNPDINIQTKYVDNFNDSALGKELALMMYNNGADIIANGAAVSGLGILDAAKELGKLTVGSDSDQSLLYEESDPEKAACIFTSVTKRIDISLHRAIGMFIDGTLQFGSNETLDISDGCIELIENDHYRANVPEDVRQEVEELKEKLLSGEIVPPSAYGMTNEEITAYLTQ